MGSYLAGLAAIVLIYAVGARAFASPRLGALAAALLATTPLLWRQVAVAPASLYPLPFVAGWLWAVSHLGDVRSTWWAAAAGACLGLGIYTSPASAVMMPLYIALTVAVFARTRSVPLRDLGVCVLAGAVVALPFALSWLTHPADFRHTIAAYHLYDAERFNVLQGAREMTSWVGLTARSEVYWDYFNPAFLFLNGGVLLLPLILLLPAGAFGVLRDDSTPLMRLVLAGLLTAPLAASLTAEAPMPGRILFLTPFAAMVSTFGAHYMLSVRRRAG